MDLWSPSASQAEQYERAGYLIVPGLLPAETAFEMRRVIKTVILSPEADESANPDPAEAVEGEDLLTPAGHHHGQQDRSRTRQPPNGAVTSS